VLGGLICFFAGLLMLGGAALFSFQAHQLIESNTAATGRRHFQDANTAPPAIDGASLVLPAYSSHLDDVSLLLTLAKEQGVSLGPINYRSEARPPLPVVVRMLDLRIEEEYPKLKGFVAELLKRMPHLYLEEIRVEQGNAATSKVQATVKLSFAYETSKNSGLGITPVPANDHRGVPGAIRAVTNQ